MRNWFAKNKLSDFERRLIDNVEKHGCHINGVYDADGSVPSFAYSIGLSRTLGRLGKTYAPEVIVFGLPKETVGPTINGLLAMCASGTELTEGSRLDGFFGEFDCVVRMVHESQITEEYFNSAIWYHRTQLGCEFDSAAMLVWPDTDHRFPWDEGCAEWVRADQPALYEPRLNS